MYNMPMKSENSGGLCALNAGISFSVCVVLLVLLSLVVSAIISVSGSAGSEWAAYASYLVSPIAIVITLAVMYTRCGAGAKSLFPVRTHAGWYAVALALVFGLMFSLGSLNELLISALENVGYVRRQSSLPDMSGWNIVPVLIVVAVLPALCEELLFRAMILNNAASETGDMRAILLTGMCFSLYHGSVEQTIYQFICGCAFAWLAVRSRSVGPAVFAHFANNASIIILSACGAYDASGALAGGLWVRVVVYILSAVSLIVSIIALAWAGKRRKSAYGGQNTSVQSVGEQSAAKGYRQGVAKFFLGAAVGIAAMAVQWVAGLFV